MLSRNYKQLSEKKKDMIYNALGDEASKYSFRLSIVILQNRPCPHSRYNSKMMHFYTCYFSYDWQRGTCYIKSNGKNNELRNKSWKPECVGSFNMDQRILVFYPEPEARDKFNNICQSMLKLKTHSGFHDLFRF